jgi:hypothetical protein
MKKNMIKVSLLAFVVLGLTACNGTVENQDSPTQTTVAEQGAGGSSSEVAPVAPSAPSAQHDLSFFDDFPEWWIDSLTEAEKEMFLDTLTAEQLEEMREQVEGLDPSMLEGTQIMIAPPGGGMEPNEDGPVIFGQDSPTQTTEAEQGAGGSSSEVAPVAPSAPVASSAPSAQRDLSFFDDFPEWWRDSTTEAEKQMFLDFLTAEQLEEMRVQVEGLNPSVLEGNQRMIIAPGEGIEPNEDGLVIFN